MKQEELKLKRESLGLTQKQVASYLHISRGHLNQIEIGNRQPSEKLLRDLNEFYKNYEVEKPIEILFDYVRIRFPTTNVCEVIEKLMRLRVNRMIHEERAFYGYAEQCVLGDITVMFHPDVKMGVLLELKGKGCRQFERYLEAQKRTWFDFMREAEKMGGIFKRIDIAINDCIGLLDIPLLIKKCERGEYISCFKKCNTHKSHGMSHEVIRKGEQGNTLYLGSMKSEVYFCIYEKAYEQYEKYGVEIGDSPVKNRFELRLKNDRAKHYMDDLLSHEDMGKTAFSVINRYVCFLDRTVNKEKEEWKINDMWLEFIQNEERKLRITTEPEPYTVEQTYRWFERQVAQSYIFLKKLDECNGTPRIKNILENTVLDEKHQKLIEQQKSNVEDMIL